MFHTRSIANSVFWQWIQKSELEGRQHVCLGFHLLFIDKSFGVSGKGIIRIYCKYLSLTHHENQIWKLLLTVTGKNVIKSFVSSNSNQRIQLIFFFFSIPTRYEFLLIHYKHYMINLLNLLLYLRYQLLIK